MSDHSKDKTLGTFSEKRFAVPFGRYVGSTEVQPPADEVLVGREGQRSYLIDLLISTGRRGAYLVTGRRGTGKTSFVKHCISEYEDSVFSRFLRANVGRGVWDRLLVLVFWSALLLGGLVLSELIQQLVPSAPTRDILPWLALVPVGIALLYPCVYAKVVFDTILREFLGCIKKDWGESSFLGLGAALCVVGLMGIAWFLVPYSEPAATSLLIPLICGIYLFAQAVSFEMAETKEDPQKGRQPWNIRQWRKLILIHVFLGVYLALILNLALCFMHDDPAERFRAHLGLGILFLGVGFLLRGGHQRSLAGRVDLGSSARREHDLLEAIPKALRGSAKWYALAGILSLAAGIFLESSRQQPFDGDIRSAARFLAAFTFLILAYFVWTLFRSREAEVPQGSFRPRPGWALTAKAVLCVAVALQLAYPVLTSIHFLIEPRLAERLPDFCQSGALCEDSRADLLGEGPILFSSRGQEVHWFRSVLFLVLLVYFLEYEWIIRPYLRVREERVLGPVLPAVWDDWQDEPLVRSSYRNLAELTLPWLVYKSWLPVLSVSVNLGFDKLDHRQIVQAMLVGLRERYYRTFLAWSSAFANLGRFIGILVVLMLVTLVGGPRLEDPRGQMNQKDKRDSQEEIWLRVLNYNLLPRVERSSWGKGASEKLLVFDLLPHSSSESYVPIPTPRGLLQLFPPELYKSYKQVHFRVYHLLLFALLLLLGRWLLFKIPLLPYKENLRRIEDLLDSLSVRTRVTSSLNLWGPARWVYSIFVDERVREVEREPVDPRTVELAFLQILDDVQKGGFRFPGAARHHLTMPAPEITFIFDELDKLGTRVDPGLMNAPLGQDQETKVLQQERERSVKLRTLLSDLKNILASAPARFIFVGGRDLHDEWLADQTSRQPLLTSIFNTEVYLPSLMTDQSSRAPQREWRLHRRIEEYFYYQYERARILHGHSIRKRWRPSFGLSVEALSLERFVSEPENEIGERIDAFEIFNCETGDELKPGENSLLREFVLFLTHRSMGNPKKLKDLFASFIRPSAREIKESERWRVAPCRHVLRFSDTEVFRIQLLVGIYRHLGLAFEERMVRRDDKFATSIFFLTDFLFKFHRRAFSWSNLERVDDLAHIHRLPDLRDLQEEIVNHFSERYLHRMLNGMYAFRFRSDIANEVEYLSRQSATEMAAFNFTLDESQSLKAEYEGVLKGKEERNPDLVAALGELYEFDQDFERARYHYRHAIELLDKELRELTMEIDPESGAFRPGAPIRSILAAKEPGSTDARRFLDWGATRLRFMLQIGMTFEHARDLERAAAEYRNCRTLARALLRAYVDEQGRQSEEDVVAKADEQKSHRLHSLKHMNIVFQPLFAEAWLSEKMIGAIDTSISLVERGLWKMRSSLPFVRTLSTDSVVTTDVTKTRHANFALTLSQLHNKAGDLFFFKGRQPISPTEIKGMISDISNEEANPGKQGSPDRPIDGYLLRAHYHYAVGLHELRRYVWQRVKSSPVRLSIAKSQAKTLKAESLPDFLFRAAAGGVNDMAEATLARVSLFDLFRRLRNVGSVDVQILRELDLSDHCNRWLGGSDEESRNSVLKNWFGEWQGNDRLESEISLIAFTGPDSAEKRLAMSLRLCLVGAGYFEKGGYPEDAGRELLQVCETVTRYLWWGHAVGAIGGHAISVPDADKPGECFGKLKKEVMRWSQGDQATVLVMSDIFSSNAYWSFLMDTAVYALEKADSLFRESRYEVGAKRGRTGGYLIGESVPTEALTLLCSLGIAGDCLLDGGRGKRLLELYSRWTGHASNEPVDFWDVLRQALLRHRYPMINRLNGMKVLIDALVLKKTEKKNAMQQAREWAEELLDLNTQFDAPLHFTPLYSGTTCALLWLRWMSDPATRGDTASVERIYRAAQRDLHNSEEMYTMRRAYYEAINDLYYLYDDFNDRQIHFNHAIQMAGTELTAILKRLIDLREEVDSPFPS